MTASELILKKALVASDLDSSQWNQIQAGFRNRAFFSSCVAKVNIVSAMRGRVADYVKSGVDISEARKLMRRDLEQLKYSPKPGEEDTVKDLFSKARLDVILKTNEAQARGYIEHLGRMKPGAFAAFPAQEFLRVEARKAQRKDWPERWRKAGGKIFGGRMIALKDDPVWVNLSVFGNPFPPFDWGSGMGVRGIDRDEAEKLGLVTREELKAKVEELKRKPAPDFNANLQATIEMRHDSPEADELRKVFGIDKDEKGALVSFEKNVLHWHGERIREVVEGTLKKVNLGRGYDGRNLSLSHNIIEEHIIKHVGDNDHDHRNIPLERGDFELIPAIWRKPDKVARQKGCDVLELDAFDGILRLVVDPNVGIVSFYKMKRPGGA